MGTERVDGSLGLQMWTVKDQMKLEQVGDSDFPAASELFEWNDLPNETTRITWEHECIEHNHSRTGGFYVNKHVWHLWHLSHRSETTHFYLFLDISVQCQCSETGKDKVPCWNWTRNLMIRGCALTTSSLFFDTRGRCLTPGSYITQRLIYMLVFVGVHLLNRLKQRVSDVTPVH